MSSVLIWPWSRCGRMYASIALATTDVCNRSMASCDACSAALACASFVAASAADFFAVVTRAVRPSGSIGTIPSARDPGQDLPRLENRRVADRHRGPEVPLGVGPAGADEPVDLVLVDGHQRHLAHEVERVFRPDGKAHGEEAQ